MKGLQHVAPVPMSVDCTVVRVQGDGALRARPSELRISIQFSTPTGLAIYFVDAATADALAQGLIRLAIECRSGIVVPQMEGL